MSAYIHAFLPKSVWSRCRISPSIFMHLASSIVDVNVACDICTSLVAPFAAVHRRHGVFVCADASPASSVLVVDGCPSGLFPWRCYGPAYLVVGGVVTCCLLVPPIGYLAGVASVICAFPILFYRSSGVSGSSVAADDSPTCNDDDVPTYSSRIWLLRITVSSGCRKMSGPNMSLSRCCMSCIGVCSASLLTVLCLCVHVDDAGLVML